MCTLFHHDDEFVGSFGRWLYGHCKELGLFVVGDGQAHALNKYRTLRSTGIHWRQEQIASVVRLGLNNEAQMMECGFGEVE